MRCEGYIARMGKMRDILVSMPQGKRHYIRCPRQSWHNSITVDLKEINCESVDWTHLAQDDIWCSSCEFHNEPLVTLKGDNFLAS
jgi:hypothetical protein